jgi:hypothetical protein
MQTVHITIKKVFKVVEEGRIDCISSTDAPKLAGRKRSDMMVKMQMFWP